MAPLRPTRETTSSRGSGLSELVFPWVIHRGTISCPKMGGVKSAKGKFALFKHTRGYESMQLTRQRWVPNLYRNRFWLQISYAVVGGCEQMTEAVATGDSKR